MKQRHSKNDAMESPKSMTRGDWLWWAGVGLLSLILLILARWVFAVEVRPEAWPAGEAYSRRGKTTDLLLPGAGLTMEPQGSNPGTTQTLFSGATGFLFYGGDDRTDQLPGRSQSKLTVSPDDPRADYWGPGALEAAIVAADLETTPCMIELWPGTHTVTQKWFLPEGVSLCGRPGQEAATIIQGNNDSVPPGWYTAPSATTSALFQTLGDNLVENLTMINLRTIYPSVCLYATCAGGEFVIARNCAFSGAGLGADALYVRPAAGATVTVEHCSAVDGIDSLSIAPQGTGVALVRDSRFLDVGGTGRSCWISGNGTVVFDQCEFWAKAAGLGNWDFNNTFDGGGADVIANGCNFYNGSTRLAPGRIVTSVTSGTGWNIYQNACVGAPNYSGPAIIWHDWNATMEEADANRYRINGVEVIGPTRVGDFSSLEIGGVETISGLREIDATTATLSGAADVNGLRIDGVEVITSERVIPTANIVMDADPFTTYGIATKHYVDQSIPTFQTLYLEGGASDVAGYLVMSPAIPSLPEDDVTVASLVNDQIIEEWIGPPGGLGTPTIPAGSYELHFHAEKTAGIQGLQIYACLFLRTNLGVETLLGTTEDTSPITDKEAQTVHMSMEEQILSGPEDRIVKKLYAVVTGTGTAPTVAIYFQGTTDSKLALPVTSGAYAQLTQPNEFLAENTFKKNILVNTGLGDNDTKIYGTGATPIASFDASTNRLGVGTSFPSALLDVNGNSELNGTVDVNGQLIAESSSSVPLIGIRSGLTAGSGVATGLQVIAKYSTTPLAGDGATINLVADDGSQQTVAAIWGKKVDASSGRLELRDLTTGSLVLSAHSEGGVFYTDLTQWHYFDAVGCGAGEVFPLGGGGAVAWDPNALTNAAYMKSTLDGISMVFPIPYEPGTILTRLSARWQGVGAGDGVIVSLQERQGGTVAAGWSTVGAAQTWTGTTETNNIYDFADKTMLAGYAYRVQVEAERVTSESRLWDIGIETDVRAH